MDIRNVIQRAASRTFILRHLSSFKANEIKLKNMYCTILQSVLEYSSVVYGPMLAKYEINRLENIQEMLEIHI